MWDLFAGVGPFAVLAARRGVTVLANDLNPHACSAMLGNFERNGVLERAHVYNLDAAEFVRSATASAAGLPSGVGAMRWKPLAGSAAEHATIGRAAEIAETRVPDHILLNLPADSLRFLPILSVLRDAARLPTSATPGPLVHCYSFSKLACAEKQASEAQERIAKGLGRAPSDLKIRPIRSVAPGKEMLCYEFPLHG